MHDDRKPIYSSREDEPGLEEAIGEFVIRLAERVDTLQDLYSSCDWTTLSSECGKLAEEARSLGYELLADVAGRVLPSSEVDDPGACETALLELAAISQRIRKAHRGSA